MKLGFWSGTELDAMDTRQHTPLTADDAVALAAIIEAARAGRRIARLDDAYTDGLAVGTARHLVRGASFAFLTADDDVREAYLRVTMASGFDDLWPVEDLIELVKRHEVSLDYSPPEPSPGGVSEGPLATYRVTAAYQGAQILLQFELVADAVVMASYEAANWTPHDATMDLLKRVLGDGAQVEVAHSWSHEGGTGATYLVEARK